jgi:hypothetical protein
MKSNRCVPPFLNGDEKKLAQIVIFLVNLLLHAFPSINLFVLSDEEPTSMEIENEWIRVVPFILNFKFPIHQQLITQNFE